MADYRPQVSVGLPVCNGERFLKEAVDSILAQTFQDFELIISDNGSTDGTPEICRAYAAQDSRVRYYRYEQNRGAAWNYNHVFELATGQYFKWAAHDDLCGPEYLERCVEVLDRELGVVLCYPKTVVIDEQGQPIENLLDDFNLRSPRPRERYEYYHHRFRRNRKCNAVFGLIRTDTLRMTPLIGNYTASDEVLLGELALRGEFYEIPEPLFFRRDHPQSSVRAYAVKERAVWFDPAKKGKIQTPRWRWFFEQLRSIRRVPLSWGDKIYCYRLMSRWVLWNRKKLKNELVMVVKEIFHLSSPTNITRRVNDEVA